MDRPWSCEVHDWMLNAALLEQMLTQWGRAGGVYFSTKREKAVLPPDRNRRK